MHNDPATMANVASQNTLVDDGVGKVLAALKRKGLERNTLVIFSSDQGNFYGQHGLWEHTVVTTLSNLYETTMNIPLIMRHPGVIEPRRVNEELIGQYDIPVTVLDYLGIRDAVFPNSPGQSFAALLRGADVEWGDKVFFEQEETRGIRTRRFSYWKRMETTGKPELYDMELDPGQSTNVYGHPDYDEAAAELDKELDIFFREYSTAQYDLWRGGTAKGSVIRPENNNAYLS